MGVKRFEDLVAWQLAHELVGRYFPREFARFLRIAAASLHETKNHLHHARDRKFLSDVEHSRLVRLTIRALAANTSLVRYLAHATAPDPFKTDL